jgi:regulator of sigma E protease
MTSGGLLYSFVFFVIAIGVLVTFHEFGHYWVARKLNVKVLRFSVGFGKPLLVWRRKIANDEIEYAISAIPLGGYVKMLDEREAPVDTTEKHRAFNTQPVAKRAAIVVAGPLFNFILAIILYWVVFLNGEDGTRPIISPVESSIAAQAGFENEDEIISVGDVPVPTWQAFRLELIDQGIDGGELTVVVKTADNQLLTRSLNIGDRHILANSEDVIDQLGFELWRPELPPVIGGTTDSGAAHRAGLLAGDRILSVNGEAINDWAAVVDVVQKHPEQLLRFLIDRNGVELTLHVTPDVRKQNEQQTGYIGAYQDIPEEVLAKLQSHVDYNIVEAASKAVEKTWSMSLLTLRVLGKMLLGEAALENISGPITIATYAGITASISMISYIGFLAVISVSLGVLNLLPVPMLDGGHLFYYLLEVIKGSPVSEKFEEIAQQIGLALLLMLMALAMYNDIQRLLN